MKQMRCLLIGAALLIGSFGKSFAQAGDECTVLALDTLPAMFVYKHIANERKLEFFSAIGSKYEALKTATGKQEFFMTYTAKAVRKLFDKINNEEGVRVFFARYSKFDGSGLPKDLETGRLILLFATEKKDQPQPDEYCFLNHLANDDSVYTVKASDAADWIWDYNTNVQKNLRPTLIPGDASNLDPNDPPGVYSDTKSIFYTKEMIYGAFYKEVEFQSTHFHTKVEGFRVTFSSYTDKGNEIGQYKKRLFIQFDYLDKDGNIINQEDQPDFKCRETKYLRNLKASIRTEQEKKNKTLDADKIARLQFEILRILALNKGLLCPTNCPPRPSKK